ncbi:MAG TPA: transglutaminaseTgpA domain-containing protein [Solirubrobacteraceae bacterium]|nr:transglutaminaseTgpA domain-containing protein [Solirubrobacteraceae bacterium]
MPTARRPAALLPAPLARTLGFALLATLGAAEWARMLEGGGLGEAIAWVLAAVLAGETVAAAGRLPAPARVSAAALAAALGLVLAALASGLEPRLLAPARWPELSAGISRGLETLSGVTLPYGGFDPWPDVTLRLGGALLVTLAASLAGWPRAEERGYPFFALAVLLVLVATPVTAIGSPRSLALGAALAALTVCFLWLERLPLRPGIGVAVLGGLALAGALPLSAAADREDPWFDYRTWAEGLGTPASMRFDWEHSYGPLTWKREGREMLRISTPRPHYWKLENLEDFDGRQWLRRGVPDPFGSEPEADLDEDWDTRAGWTATARVTVRALRGEELAGAGTTVAVDAGSRRASPTFSPGTWQADAELEAGDSYSVRFHAPRPNPVQLAAASSGSRGEQGDALELVLPLLLAEPPPPDDTRRPVTAMRLKLRPFAARGQPLAQNERRGTSRPGVPALRNSPYWRTWRLAQRLKRGARTPYEFVRRVDAFLDRDFRYDERPAPAGAGEVPLDHFLFTGRAGYCQHFSGAMALLLRLGGVPARVATGFSPGGFRRRQGEWVVRDRDAHSWVEAWFDGIGWVTFDPTPAGTPARSLIAAINAPGETGTTDSAADAAGAGGARGARDPVGARGELDQPGPAAAAGASRGDGGPGAVLLTVGGGALLLVLLAALALVLRRHARARPQLARADRADRAVADLVVALRRAGRPLAPGTTLFELERRLGARREGSAYLTALRAARYGPDDSGPTAEQRRVFRRELAAGLGWRGRLRAWWALPPRRR